MRRRSIDSTMERIISDAKSNARRALYGSNVWVVMEGSYECWVVAVCSTLEHARQIEKASNGIMRWVEEWERDTDGAGVTV